MCSDDRIILEMDGGEWRGTLAELIADNEAPGVESPGPEYWQALRDLQPGQSVTLGGGAAGAFTFRRIGLTTPCPCDTICHHSASECASCPRCIGDARMAEARATEDDRRDRGNAWDDCGRSDV